MHVGPYKFGGLWPNCLLLLRGLHCNFAGIIQWLKSCGVAELQTKRCFDSYSYFYWYPPWKTVGEHSGASPVAPLQVDPVALSGTAAQLLARRDDQPIWTFKDGNLKEANDLEMWKWKKWTLDILNGNNWHFASKPSSTLFLVNLILTCCYFHSQGVVVPDMMRLLLI